MTGIDIETLRVPTTRRSAPGSGSVLFWEVVQECEIERGRDANGDGEIAIVRWKKY